MSLLLLLSTLSIGLVLGLLGAGGSILTLPVLVHLADVPIKEATAYSLVIVGILSFVGAIKAFIDKEVDVRVGLYFAFPALISIYLTRWLLVPIVPELLISVVFIGLMLLVGLKMMLGKKESKDLSKKQISQVWVIVDGLIVGALTGLVGAGGGFLIVPALMLFCKIDPKRAVGTSLFVIALKSSVGLIGDFQNGAHFDPKLLLFFIGVGALGVLLGHSLKKYLHEDKIKKLFAGFLILMSIILAALELL